MQQLPIKPPLQGEVPPQAAEGCGAWPRLCPPRLGRCAAAFAGDDACIVPPALTECAQGSFAAGCCFVPFAGKSRPANQPAVPANRFAGNMPLTYPGR